MASDMNERFLRNVIPEPNSGCWLWDGLANSRGYGRIGVNGQDQRAHRVSYEMHCGPIPDGHMVCHRCDVPACVNPDHLFLGSAADNHSDMRRKGRGGFGERHGRAKLSEADVITIAAMLADGSLSHAEIARRHGLSRGRISDIASGKTWRHVTRAKNSEPQ